MDYATYQAYRSSGATALEAHRLHQEVQTEVAASGNIIALMINKAMGVMACIMISKYIYELEPLRYEEIWITSPSGGANAKLPILTAMRVIRRHRWSFAKVEPVKPKRIVSRKEAVKILFFGDNRRNGKGLRTMEKQRGLA